MKTIKFTLLLLGLFLWSNSFACFDMIITPLPINEGDKYACFQVDVNLTNITHPKGGVLISDGGKNTVFAQNSYSNVWCYLLNDVYPVTISCQTVNNTDCQREDSCIVIIDNGGGL